MNSKTLIVSDRRFGEYNNSGAGSSTASWDQEAVATLAVSKTLLWRDDHGS